MPHSGLCLAALFSYSDLIDKFKYVILKKYIDIHILSKAHQATLLYRAAFGRSMISMGIIYKARIQVINLLIVPTSFTHFLYYTFVFTYNVHYIPILHL